MQRLRSLLACLALVGGSPAVAGDELPLRELPAPVARVLAAHGMPADSYSAWVQDVAELSPIVAVNPDEPRNPASTIKLLTTFLALEALGPAFTWHTDAFLGGPLVEGQLDGDLLIKGYGDPYLVTERVWLFLRQLRLEGLAGIGGDLVIDNSFYALEPEEPGAFDGQALRAYNVVPDALLVNFKAVNFRFRPDPVNNRVEIIADPRPANLEIQNRVALADGRCAGAGSGIRLAVAEPPGGANVRFSGTLGRDCTEYRLSRALLDAPAFAYGVIRQLWEEGGGTLDGTLRTEPVPPGLAPFVSFDSPPLGDVIRAINKWSNNVMTRQLFLTLGVEQFGPPATLDKSRRAAAALLVERGLDFPELTIDNGSGLSRRTRIAARSLARLLLAAHASPFGPEFVSSLAVAGMDGTLRRRFADEQLAGRMHLKTGRLDGVFAMVGFLKSRSGREYAVVAIQNHPDAHRGPGEEAHSALMRWVFAR